MVMYEVAPGVMADVPIDVLSRAYAEAELTVMREKLLDDLTADDDPGADRRLEASWTEVTGRHEPAEQLRKLGGALMTAWNEHEAIQRARLKLPAREPDTSS
jgi:hypothetical protein